MNVAVTIRIARGLCREEKSPVASLHSLIIRDDDDDDDEKMSDSSSSLFPLLYVPGFRLPQFTPASLAVSRADSRTCLMRAKLISLFQHDADSRLAVSLFVSI